MKDYLRAITQKQEGVTKARLVLREYLQARILESLQESGAFENWAFLGGTALRFLYGLPRFSEDLDFSLCTEKGEDNFLDHIKRIENNFKKEDYNISSSMNDTPPVKSAFVKFEGLLEELHLSPHKHEKVSIKVDIDTNPPVGAETETSIIRKYSFLHILHYDKSSLFAGKIHALLARSYHKGRDLYDLLWYLSDPTWPEPNFTLLNNALLQTGHWEGKAFSTNNWRELVGERLKKLDWYKITEDLSPFLENREELTFVSQENLLKLLLRR